MAVPAGLTGSRVHGGHLLALLLLLLCSALAVRAAAALRAPPAAIPAVPDPVVADRELLQRVDPFFGPAESGETLPVTSLPITLHGVRTDSATGRGSAIVALADGQQTVVAVGEEVTDGVRLVAVAIDHVIIERAGSRESLWMANAGGSEGASPAVSGPAIAAAAPGNDPQAGGLILGPPEMEAGLRDRDEDGDEG